MRANVSFPFPWSQVRINRLNRGLRTLLFICCTRHLDNESDLHFCAWRYIKIIFLTSVVHKINENTYVHRNRRLWQIRSLECREEMTMTVTMTTYHWYPTSKEKSETQDLSSTRHRTRMVCLEQVDFPPFHCKRKLSSFDLGRLLRRWTSSLTTENQNQKRIWWQLKPMRALIIVSCIVSSQRLVTVVGPMV